MPNPFSSASPPAPSATRRRRHRRRQLLSPFSNVRTSPSVSASSPSSPVSSGPSIFSFASFSRSPSPFHHRFLSPLHSASAVPFAWEHRPGVPKTPVRQSRANKHAAKAPRPLPLPPSLLYRKVGADDPFFVAANADCFVVPESSKARRRRLGREPALAAATLNDWLAVLSLYRSCTLPRDCLTL